MNSKRADWTYLAREAFLLLICAYVILLGGGFGALVDFRLQAFSTILATVVLGAWLVIKLIGKAKLPLSGFDWAILLFLISQSLAVAFSEDPRRSLPHAILWLVYVFIFYFALDIMRRGWPQELIVKCLLIIGALVLMFSIVNLGQLYMQWRNLTVGLEFFPGFQQRLSTVLGDPNLLAAFINLLIPLAIATFFLTGSNAVKAALALYLGISLVILFFTDSRGGLLGLAGSIGTFAVLWILVVSETAKRQVRHTAEWLWNHKALLFGMGLVVIAAVGFIGWRFLSFEGDTTHAPALEARDIYWDASLDAVQLDPLTGAGPGMYPIYLMKIWSTPPARPYLHAHSFPFQVAAESGLLGLAGLAILILAIARRAREAWRELDFQARARWGAALAALVGLGTHSLVDDFFPFPAVGMTAFVLLAIVMSAEPAKATQRNVSPWMLAAPGLAATVFSFYGLNAYFHADRAVAFGTLGDWQAAASEMETAARADPGFSFYWLQTGYAYGRAAELNSELFDGAIANYVKGIDLEPEYALSHANLGALYWLNGLPELALQEMRIATGLAPGAWQFWLNQGAYEEKLSLPEEALASYGRAMSLNPEISGANFWSSSEVRNSAIQGNVESGVLDDPRTRATALVRDARELIKISDFSKARSLLIQAYALNDQEVSIYVALGELALAEGELHKAEQHVQLALWIQTTSNQAKVEAILLGAEISLAQGDRKETFDRYQIAYNAILAETSYGWGSYGWSPYAWFVFQRRAFPEDLLPQLERADITTEIATRLLPLADLYEEAGDTQKAQGLREALQPYLP